MSKISQKSNLIKAAILKKVKKPLVIKNLKFPKLAKGQVLVKIFYSGICRSQIFEIDGCRGKDKWLPHLLGHEGSGIILDTGYGVKKVKKNDEVILTWIMSKGIDANQPKYLSNDSKINSGKVSTFSNYAVVSENRVIKKPKNLSFDLAVLFGCAVPTGMGMVTNEVKNTSNKSFAIIGIGGVGIFSIIALKKRKVNEIIAIDKSQNKLNLARKLGIKKCFNVSEKKFMKKFLKATKNNGVDYCLETTGTTQGIEQGFSLINKNKGQLLFASHPPKGTKIKIDPHELIKGKKISGSWGGGTNPDSDIIKYYNIIKKSKINIKKFMKIYKFNKINSAIKEARKSKYARIILEMEH